MYYIVIVIVICYKAICYIWKRGFRYHRNKKKFKIRPKERDHCHHTGNFRRAAHSICNLKAQISK